jgi:hypothetical protein
MASRFIRDKRGRFAGSGSGRLKSGLAGKKSKSKSPSKTLNKTEKAYLEIKSQKSKFKSDRKVFAEMQRRGFLKGADPMGQLIKVASNARTKQGAPF